MTMMIVAVVVISFSSEKFQNLSMRRPLCDDLGLNGFRFVIYPPRHLEMRGGKCKS
jgi:hypothetical protein